MKDTTITIIAKLAKRAGYTGTVTGVNAGEIVQSLAENHTEMLGRRLDALYRQGVKCYTGYNDAGDEAYNHYTGLADSVLTLLNIELDYSAGLYPIYGLTRGGKHFTEYSAFGAIRQHINFWHHWKAEEEETKPA